MTEGTDRRATLKILAFAGRPFELTLNIEAALKREMTYGDDHKQPHHS